MLIIDWMIITYIIYIDIDILKMTILVLQALYICLHFSKSILFISIMRGGLKGLWTPIQVTLEIFKKGVFSRIQRLRKINILKPFYCLRHGGEDSKVYAIWLSKLRNLKIQNQPAGEDIKVNTSLCQNNNNAHASNVAQASLCQLLRKNYRMVEISKFSSYRPTLQKSTIGNLNTLRRYDGSSMELLSLTS